MSTKFFQKILKILMKSLLMFSDGSGPPPYEEEKKRERPPTQATHSHSQCWARDQFLASRQKVRLLRASATAQYLGPEIRVICVYRR